MGRDTSRGEGKSLSRPLCLVDALLRSSQLLPDRVRKRLGKGDADARPGVEVRQESRRQPLGDQGKSHGSAVLRGWPGRARSRGGRHCAHGNVGLDGQLPLHLRSGQSARPPCHKRHQPRRLLLSSAEGRGLPISTSTRRSSSHSSARQRTSASTSSFSTTAGSATSTPEKTTTQAWATGR